jgi:hypothetical protein
LAEQAKVKRMVDSAQERIRKNIDSLVSKDGIKDNPIVTRYLTALSDEEDKYTSSCAKEAELQAEKVSIGDVLLKTATSTKTSLLQRYLNPLK